MAKRINLDATRNLEHQRETRQGTDPNDRPQRPFIMKGDYPPPEAQAEIYPGMYEDAFAEEQQTRLSALEHESGPLHGSYPAYPDRGTPNSPEQYEREQEHAAYLRACHGGVTDAPGEARAVGKRPFKGLRG